MNGMKVLIRCFAFSSGGFVYKKSIIDAIVGIVEENVDARETGLAHLCEFIEDCEHDVLATRILHLLGDYIRPELLVSTN